MLMIATTAAACAMANADDAVTKAASNFSNIREALAESGGTSASAFAADLLTAIAAKAKSPQAKLQDLIDASKILVDNRDEGKLSDMVVSLVSSIPFEDLPTWTSAMMDTVNPLVTGMEESAYNSLVADVVKKISGLADFTDDDKTVITAFALKLLMRNKDPDLESEPLKSAIAAAPASYSKQLAQVLPSTFSGDYGPVLGGTEIVTLPTPAASSDTPVQSRTSTTPTADTVGTTPIGTLSVPVAPGKSSPEPKPQPKPSTPVKPPVPPVYKGQF